MSVSQQYFLAAAHTVCGDISISAHKSTPARRFTTTTPPPHHPANLDPTVADTSINNIILYMFVYTLCVYIYIYVYKFQRFESFFRHVFFSPRFFFFIYFYPFFFFFFCNIISLFPHFFSLSLPHCKS